MPILPAEPDLYPAELWEHLAGEGQGLFSASPETRWMCLHTKPRQEKAVARQLRESKVPHYLPLINNVHRTPGGRKVHSVVPLFTSYLFIHGGPAERLGALRTNRLVNIIDVTDQHQLEGDLRQVHTMMNSGLPVRSEPSYPVGTRVRIVSGPLRGLTGTVYRREKRDQFVAIVQLLGCGAAVDLEDWQVEKVA